MFQLQATSGIPGKTPVPGSATHQVLGPVRANQHDNFSPLSQCDTDQRSNEFQGSVQGISGPNEDGGSPARECARRGIATYPPCAVFAVCSLACSRADRASLAQALAIPEDEDDNTPLSASTKALLESRGPKVPTVTQSFKVRRVHSQVVQFYYFIISNKECVQTRRQKVSRTVGCGACGHAHRPRMRARTLPAHAGTHTSPVSATQLTRA